MYSSTGIHDSELLLRLPTNSHPHNGLGEVRKLVTRSTSTRLASSAHNLHEDTELVTYIFPDFGAVDYFQKEFATTGEFHVVEESEAGGFEIYLVDLWVHHRRIGTVVSVFTGNDESRAKVARFTIKKMPTKHYPPRFQEYLNETILNHASYKRMSTPDSSSVLAFSSSELVEYLLVTNIAALPSAVNLVPIPNGDARAVKATFAINSNLKKLNCAGRSLSLLTEKVSSASEDKFRQMYRIYNELVPIRFAVRELINLIQTSLFYFDLLDARYCDGLLCQKTEDAINNWWNLIGLPHFNVKPNPRAGILPAKTVAAVISLTISVKMRLHLFGGCDAPKDPYDFENLMISIGQFQKQVKLDKKRKLDLITLLSLFYYTNKKLPFASKQQYSALGSELSLTEGSYTDLSSNFASSRLSPSPQYSPRSLSNQTASAYRRNKLHYSKELKKLTNAVKNTVQDHIIVREDNEGFFPEPSNKTGAKLRSKIASKLSDLLTPSDVETTDLDILVKRYLVGRTLLKLWLGLGKPTEVSTLSLEDKLHQLHHNHHHHHHHHLHRRNVSNDPPLEGENSKYHFVCLKDGFMMSRDLLALQNSEKSSGRLGRMKFALQGRRPNPIRELDLPNSNGNGYDQKLASSNERFEFTGQKQSHDNTATCVGSEAKAQCNATIHTQDLRKIFNRRNSFPFLCNGAELNIHTVEAIETSHKPLEGHCLRKCASFSTVEDLFHGNNELENKENLKISYVNNIWNMIKLERLRKYTEVHHTQRMFGEYKRINIELVKLHSIHSRVVNKQLFINSEYSLVLKGRMKDLTDNIDRMTFRSRDLAKKINELEENAHDFNLRLQEACFQKLGELVDGLANSQKFRDVFRDDKERRLIMQDLGIPDDGDDADGKRSLRGLRLVVAFAYEVLLFFLRFLIFDGPRMNLDRIRRSYRMVDPNSRQIEEARGFFERDSAERDSAAARRRRVGDEDAPKQDGSPRAEKADYLLTSALKERLR